MVLDSMSNHGEYGTCIMYCIGYGTIQLGMKRVEYVRFVYIRVHPAVSAHSLAFPWRRM